MTYIEWMTCGLYMLTAAAALRCTGVWGATRLQRSTARRLWTLLSVGLILFGVNKIADLQTPLLEGLKSLALKAGMREHRLPLKIIFLAAVGTLALLGLAALARRARESVFRPWWLACGLGCLAGYYLLRAAGSISGRLWFASPEFTWPVETVGLLLILAAAAKYFPSMDRDPTGHH